MTTREHPLGSVDWSPGTPSEGLMEVQDANSNRNKHTLVCAITVPAFCV